MSPTPPRRTPRSPAAVGRSRANAAVRAEPRGIGSARARDPLSREVKLLGSLLGQVIVEQEGPATLDLVERVRRATIALRRDGTPAGRRRLDREFDAVDLPGAEALTRAFSLYFQLANLAEEKERVRRLRRRDRGAANAPAPESVAAAVERLRGRGRRGAHPTSVIDDLSVALVLTAHPTEARRRTLLVALRRCYRLLDRLDDPRLTPGEDADVRRRLREEISLLWHTPPLRLAAPTPLDEVRTAMAYFDESIFIVTPRLYRALDAALDRRSGDRSAGLDAAARDSGRTGTRPPRVHAFLRWGSWIGGDRDGNPNVTAAVTREALRIQTDHVLRAYEAVTSRLMQTIAAGVDADDVAAPLRGRLAADARELPETDRLIGRRFPGEPYRQRFAYIAERLRRTRWRLMAVTGATTAGGYESPAALLEELDELRAALIEDRLSRVAYGELQDLRWQVETFGFHGLGLEVRQHSAVHAAVRERLAASTPDGSGASTLDAEVAPGVTVGEVLATFGAVADLQRTYGEDACHRYVVSFTRSAQDVLDVLELARSAAEADGVAGPVLDVVPLFESADALATCGRIVRELLADPGYRRHLATRGDRQEVMLGYSDSTKESGTLAANWMLYRAQEQLIEVARASGITVTLFHGRGGAIGRGGGPMSRAIVAQAPGSIQGRLKLTEQGEVVADRYANPLIAQRHLEQVTHAVLVASMPEHDAAALAAEEKGREPLEELAERSRAAYRALVWDDPVFESFFHAATPVAELAAFAIGSRPASRGGASARQAPPIASLRAIPWVFAWSQSRANLPGWYGVGTALADYERAHGPAGLEMLRELYREWPFFASMLDTVEMTLAKADMQVARRYAALAPTPEARRIWRRIKGEFDRSVSMVLRVTGRAALLEAMPLLGRSIALRNPYVDSLSETQVRLLARLRALPADDADRAELVRLVHLTVSGVAAGLQSTG